MRFSAFSILPSSVHRTMHSFILEYSLQIYRGWNIANVKKNLRINPMLELWNESYFLRFWVYQIVRVKFFHSLNGETNQENKQRKNSTRWYPFLQDIVYVISVITCSPAPKLRQRHTSHLGPKKHYSSRRKRVYWEKKNAKQIERDYVWDGHGIGNLVSFVSLREWLS